MHSDCAWLLFVRAEGDGKRTRGFDSILFVLKYDSCPSFAGKQNEGQQGNSH